MKLTTFQFTIALLMLGLVVSVVMHSPGTIGKADYEFESNLLSNSSDWGDAYANAFDPYRSQWYSNGENAIGSPDGQYAQIFLDYSSGYLTLDMGDQEEIVNGPGNDFTIIARGGNYSVFVQPTYDSSPSLIGRTNGTHSFDLDDLSTEQVQYVRVEHFVGDTIELDAIEAINYIVPTSDIYDPQILGPQDVWVWANQSLIQLEWKASDNTPNNYTVLVNGSAVEYSPWDGSDLLISITNPGTGFWNITLLLYDLSENWASDSVILEVRAVSSPDNLLFLGGVAIGGILIVVIIPYIFKARSKAAA